MKLISRERIMSRCFNWFPKLVGFIRRTLYIPRFGGVLQGSGDFTWMVSDCEELVGVTHRGMMGLVFVDCTRSLFV